MRAQHRDGIEEFIGCAALVYPLSLMAEDPLPCGRFGPQSIWGGGEQEGNQSSIPITAPTAITGRRQRGWRLSL